MGFRRATSSRGLGGSSVSPTDRLSSTTARPSRSADVRDSLFDALYMVAAKDPRVVVLTDDQAAFGLEKLRRDMPRQYVNVGIAEQNLVSVGAGLALAGRTPFLYGISTFMTMRCYEQIRVDLSCLRLHVTIVGSGPGYTYAFDGPTHHACEDVALMRAVPDLTILNPCDPVSTAASVRLAYRATGPVYVRLEKGVLPAVHAENDPLEAGYARLRPGRDATLVATGIMVHTALAVAKALEEKNLDLGVIDVYRLKPVDTTALGVEASRTACVVTLEEHSIVGGLGTILAEIWADLGHSGRLLRLALPDTHCYAYGPREWLQQRQGLGLREATERVAAWVASSRPAR